MAVVTDVMARALLVLTFLLPLGLGEAGAETWKVPKERLTYDVMYKWGLINKKAGSVALTTTLPSSGNRFKATLTGATAPWADKFYKVRDTLRGTIDSRKEKGKRRKKGKDGS